MFKIKNHLRSAIALSAVAGGSLVLFADQASATLVDTSELKILTVGFDLGNGPGFTNGVPNDPAILEWHHNWYGNIAELTGDLHFKGVAGECARVKMTSYREDGTRIGADYSDRKCAATNGHNVRTVEEGGNSFLGRPGADRVDIFLQTENPNGWVNVGSRTRYYPSPVDTDDVLISRAELDFGTGQHVNGAPSGPGKVTWYATPTDLDPVVTGTLYAKNADDLTVRMRATYYEADGTFIEARNGGQQSITDDDLHRFSVNLNDFGDGSSSFDRNSVAKVRVAIQKSPTGSNNWTTVGSQMVTLN
jgi:hypothetical protein